MSKPNSLVIFGRNLDSSENSTEKKLDGLKLS